MNDHHTITAADAALIDRIAALLHEGTGDGWGHDWSECGDTDTFLTAARNALAEVSG